jgi:MoaA/NifB/PqqE/SkfB family radical SAM enzyme
MQNIKYPRNTPPYRVFWCWNITSVCNYKCTYCIADTSWKTAYLEVKKWEEIWNEILENYGSTHIRFSGGEPFVYPDFMDLLAVLSKRHTLNVTTNLSFDVVEFVRKIGPLVNDNNITLSASLHPEYINTDEFIDKVLYLKSNGIYTSASIVAWPPFIKDIPEIKEKMEKANIQFLIIPLQGHFWGKEFPEGYNEEERKILSILSVSVSNPASEEMYTFWLNKKQERMTRRLCRMGQNFGMIWPNGDVYRCCTTDKSAYLGNMVDGTFKLLDEPAWCEIAPCKCYKAMLVGKEKDYISQWNHPKLKNGVYYEP